jgi:glycosyltransferase involved in cell wall biosynthesis
LGQEDVQPVGNLLDMRNKSVVVLTAIEAGSQARVIREVESLVSAGYKVKIVETGRLHVDGTERAHSIHTLGTVRISKVPILTVGLTITRSRSTAFRLGFGLFYFVSSLLYFLTLLRQLFATAIEEKPHIILVHNSPDLVGLAAAILNRVLGQEYIYEMHDFTPELYCEKLGIRVQSILYKMLFLLERIAVQNAKRVIVVNHTMKACMLSRHPMLRFESIVVVYSSWSRSEIRELTRRVSTSVHQSRGLQDVMTIAYSGDMEAERRGISELLEATRGLLSEGYKIKLLLIGDGEMRRFILEYISSYRLADSVFLTGWLPLKDYVALLSTCQIAVIPLRKTMLTNIATPNKLFEYMALEKLILASRLAGICEVIQEGRNGLMLDPQRLTISLRDHIKRILLEGIPPTLAANGKNDFEERFSWETQNMAFLEAIS